MLVKGAQADYLLYDNTKVQTSVLQFITHSNVVNKSVGGTLIWKMSVLTGRLGLRIVYVIRKDIMHLYIRKWFDELLGDS